MVKAREGAGLVGWVVWFRRRRCAEVGMPGQTRDVGFQYCTAVLCTVLTAARAITQGK